MASPGHTQQQQRWPRKSSGEQLRQGLQRGKGQWILRSRARRSETRKRVLGSKTCKRWSQKGPRKPPRATSFSCQKTDQNYNSILTPRCRPAISTTHPGSLMLKVVVLILRPRVRPPRTQSCWCRGSYSLPFSDFPPNPETPFSQSETRNLWNQTSYLQNILKVNIYFFNHFFHTLLWHSMAIWQKTRIKGESSQELVLKTRNNEN